MDKFTVLVVSLCSFITWFIVGLVGGYDIKTVLGTASAFSFCTFLALGILYLHEKYKG